jgi:hypothetical protein
LEHFYADRREAIDRIVLGEEFMRCLRRSTNLDGLFAFLALFIAAFPFSSALAQGLPPQKEYYVGDGQVDLLRGTFLYSNTDLVAGTGAGEIKLTRLYGVSDSGGGPFGVATAHSLRAVIFVSKFHEEPLGPGYPSYRFNVVVGGSVVATFRQGYGEPVGLESGSGSYHYLTYSSWTGPFTYKGMDGIEINFGTATIGGCPDAGFRLGGWCAVASEIKYGDGTRMSLTYDAANSLTRATNNYGYGIGFEYAATSAGKTVTKACALNFSQSYLAPSAPCPSSAPAVNYGYGCTATACGLTSYTDASGRTTTYGVHLFGIESITSPGSPAPVMTIAYYPLSAKVKTQTFANGSAWNYSYTYNNDNWLDAPVNELTTVTNPAGSIVRHEFYAEKPSFIQDELGRRVGFLYEWAGYTLLVNRRTDAEGGEIRYNYGASPPTTYSGIRVPVEVRKIAKPGSGLADIVTSATYPSVVGCTNPNVCEKPLTTTDARGNTTTYTYDPIHGGVLTETGPAVNGVQPHKRHEYAQRYAWIKNSSGAFVQAATPVWVKTREEYCAATAASAGNCAGGAADEVVTEYDYGPNSGPNNLLLRGITVTAANALGVVETLRTCYTYDANGRKISETQPMANLGSCP